MKRFTLLFALLLSIVGTMKAETLTANFNSELPEGWSIVGDLTRNSDRARSGSGVWTSSKSDNANYLVTEALEGSLTFYARAYNKITNAYVRVYAYDGSALGDELAATANMKTSSTPSWSSKTLSLGSYKGRVAIALNYACIDDLTYTQMEVSEGPALVVKDGSTKLDSPYNYNFGLATAGTIKTFTLANPGTSDLGVEVSETGDFGATLSAATIAAGSEVTLTVTMPETTGSSVVTITPDATGIDPFVINVSGTVRDANKLYEYGFTALPQDWTTTGSWYYSAANGAYTTVWYLTSNARLITPLLNVSEGETFFVEAKGYSTSNTSYQHLQMQYSADGSTWTNFDSEPTLDPTNWQTFAFTGVPAGKYYIAINASQADIRMFYGGELPVEPKMVVTQPASLDFGVITEATAKTFTIANTGLATLEGISVTSSNSSIFAVTGAPTSLAAGESAEVTITMAATTTGALSSDITVSATGMEDVQFTVTGVVLPEDMMVVDFNEGLPEKWNNVSNYWTFNNGMATGKSSYSQLITPILRFTEGNIVAIKAQCTDSDTSDYLQIYGSSDNGSTWTAYDKKIYGGSNGLALYKNGWGTIVLTDIPTTVTVLKFVGYYVNIDEIAGLNYAPVLEVYKEGQGFASPAYHHFGECSADADVTFSFSNYGGGTITITNVTVDGSDAYSTNWTESVEVPFDLVITRTYDAERVGTSEATITVTTSEGEFVINVDGSDLSADAPALGVTLEGNAVTTGDVADFGSQLQEAPKAKAYTITNTGTGTLTGTISTSNAKVFTVNATEFSLTASESMTFEVALVFDENYGSKSAVITIHPTNDGLEDIVINATASTLDPEAWTEDFADGNLPMGWVAKSWTVNTFSSYENTTMMALAPSSSTAGTLITPCLTAKEGDVLTWDGYFNWYDEPMTVEYSNDGQSTWTKIYDAYKAQDEFGSTRYTHKEMSFTAPADGDYYLRFTSTYSNGVDNFCGFKLNLPDHIMAITASNIPNSSQYYMQMKEGVSFNATVTLAESRGVEEEVTAKFYMGEEVIGTTSATVEANSTKQLTIVCTPTTSATSGIEMHIEVEWAGSTLSTETTTRYVAAITRLDLVENEEREVTSGTTFDVVTLTRNFVEGWNTFISPLSVNISEFGEGAVAYTFSSYADGVLNFSKVTTSLNPATPYIIYVPTKMENKTFTWENTSISSMHVGETNIRTVQSTWILQGTYAPIAAGGLTGKYGVTSDGHIMKAGTNASVKGFRAYFTPNEAYVNENNDNLVKGIAFIDSETGVQTLRMSAEDAQQIFDLSGRMQSKAQKGINIVNGKKVMY